MFVLKLDTKAPFSLLLVYFLQDPFFPLAFVEKSRTKTPLVLLCDGSPIIRVFWCLDTRPRARAYDSLFLFLLFFFLSFLKAVAYFYCSQHPAHWRVAAGLFHPSSVGGSRSLGDQAPLLLGVERFSGPFRFWPFVPSLQPPSARAAHGLCPAGQPAPGFQLLQPCCCSAEAEGVALGLAGSGGSWAGERHGVNSAQILPFLF